MREAHETENHTPDAPQTRRTKFGKIKNLRFRNFGSEISTAFVLPLPLAELTASEVCRSRFFEIISIFKSSTRSMRSKQLQILCKHTRQPFGIERRCLRSASNNQRREIQNFQKNAPKSERNPSLGRIWSESDFEKFSDDVTSVLVDQTSRPATNDYQSLRNYPRSNYRANGSV